ncbi:MAG: diguanylate cyclase [Bacteroidota bacterium]|nr:diguanylate cyclase [Bacteroidota bacterium]
MFRSIVGLCLVLAASIAAFFLFPDLAVRIAAGGVFFISTISLGMTLFNYFNKRNIRQGTEGGTEGSGNEDAISGRGEIASTHRSTSEKQRLSATQGGHRVGLPEEIPEHLYRFDEHDLPTDDPSAEFNFLTRRLLAALKDQLLAHTTALFWINIDRQQIVIGEFVTDSRNFTTARRIPLGSDLISNIGKLGKPVVLQNITENAEGDLLVYYDGRAGIRSFVGVPVFFKAETIAVLAADSTAADAFGIETVASMGTFTGIVSMLLASYNHKFDLTADAKLLQALDQGRRAMQSAMDPYGIATAAAETAVRLLDWDYAAVILYNSEKQGWVVMRSMTRLPNLPYVSEGVTVDVDRSVFRPVLHYQEGRILDAPQPPAFRFHEKEVVASSGQLCVAPIMTTRRCIGFLIVEYREGAQYGSRDLDVLTRVGDLTGIFLELAAGRELARKHLIIDEGTKTASRTLFLQRLREEYERIQRHGGTAVFFLVALDSPEEMLERHGVEGVETIVGQIANIIRGALAPYDVLGRYESTRFGLLLLHSTAEEAFIRGEKIRKSVASMVLSQDGSSFSVTVSLGGCTIVQGHEYDNLFRIAEQALTLTAGDGGNSVKVV